MTDVAPQPSPTATGAKAETNTDSSSATGAHDPSRPPSTRSSPRTPNSGILLPVLASEAAPGHSRSASPRGSLFVGGATTPAAMPSSYPPRSAAISSRRGRSRSPTTAVGDRRGSSLSASSIHSGHLMHKYPVTIPDHPAEMHKSGRGSSDGSSSNKTTVRQTDSRDDEQVRSLPPENVSSAAAAAAAAAASFTAANASNSKTSRSKRGYDAAGNQASTEPPQKQGRTARRSLKLGDGGNTGAWPISPIVDAKKDETPAVTSSSSAGLSPIKFDGKDGEHQENGEEPLMDFSASPLGPPEIQNSNRDEHSFLPKNFFEVSYVAVLPYFSSLAKHHNCSSTHFPFTFYICGNFTGRQGREQSTCATRHVSVIQPPQSLFRQSGRGHAQFRCWCSQFLWSHWWYWKRWSWCGPRSLHITVIPSTRFKPFPTAGTCTDDKG